MVIKKDKIKRKNKLVSNKQDYPIKINEVKLRA